MSFRVEKLEKEQMAEIYRLFLGKHFPPEEVKPLEKIEALWDMGAYQAIGIYNEDKGNELAGYAFLAFAPDCRWFLLDYYAILEDYRNSGVGGLFLQKIRELMCAYDGILIETEDVAFAQTAEERQLREKRDRFYERNGVVKTRVTSEVYGVRYAIWDFPVHAPLTDEACGVALKKVYRMFLPKDKMTIFLP